MVYNSGCSQLLSAILRDASGMTTARFAEEYLFGPLGIGQYAWETDPQGNHTGGFGLKLLPADMLKFGQLYSNKGVWNNRRVLSEAMVDQSFKAALPATAPAQGHYGWHWWISEISGTTGTGSPVTLPYYYALGFGGQYIVVVPGLRITAVVTVDKIKKRSKQVNVFETHIAPLLLKQL